MKREQFCGRVNGQTFDNVNDYNAAVQKAIAEGHCIASTSTAVIEVPEDDKETCVEDRFNFSLKDFENLSQEDTKRLLAAMKERIETMDPEQFKIVRSSIEGVLSDIDDACASIHNELSDMASKYNEALDAVHGYEVAMNALNEESSRLDSISDGLTEILQDADLPDEDQSCVCSERNEEVNHVESLNRAFQVMEEVFDQTFGRDSLFARIFGPEKP